MRRRRTHTHARWQQALPTCASTIISGGGAAVNGTARTSTCSAVSHVCLRTRRAVVSKTPPHSLIVFRGFGSGHRIATLDLEEQA